MAPQIKKPSYLVEEDTQVEATADLIVRKDTLSRSLLNKRVGGPQSPSRRSGIGEICCCCRKSRENFLGYADRIQLTGLSVLYRLTICSERSSVPCNTAWRIRGGWEVPIYSFFYLGVRCGWVVNARPVPLSPGLKRR